MSLNLGYQERIRPAIVGPLFWMKSKEPSKERCAGTPQPPRSKRTATPRLARTARYPLGLAAVLIGNATSLCGVLY